jgi:hypothetical protein
MGEELGDGVKKEVLILYPDLENVNGEPVEPEEREDAIAEAAERVRLAEEARLEAERLAKEAEEQGEEDEEAA